MTALAPYTVLATFILFCRIGACLMLMPGFSSPRVPMRVRLFVAIAITLALAPLLVDGVRDSIPDGSAVGVLGLIFSETLIGALIGLMGRMFFLALQFAGGSIAMLVGLPNTPDTMIEETDPVAAVTSLFTLTAVILLFITFFLFFFLLSLFFSFFSFPFSLLLSPYFFFIFLFFSLLFSFLLSFLFFLFYSSPFPLF
mgnify:CR=1 FL=1